MLCLCFHFLRLIIGQIPLMKRQALSAGISPHCLQFPWFVRLDYEQPLPLLADFQRHCGRDNIPSDADWALVRWYIFMEWTGFFNLFDEEYTSTSRRDRDRDSSHLQCAMGVADMLHMRHA